MNLELYIENELCDFDKSTYVALQKEFEDEQELIVKEIEYSYTISIPTSPTNKRIFGYISTFDVPNKFGRIYNAELYVDGVLILRGKFKLSGIERQYFKGNLYNPSKSTVSDVLGDRMLTEIIPHMKPMNTMNDMLQCNNYVINDASTDIPKAEYRDRHICYPYVLYNFPYNNADKAMSDNLDPYTQRLDYGYHTMTNNDVFPAFNVLSLIKDMFATEGYNVQGNIFDDEKFKDLYQTFQFNYSDYIDKKQVPYYVSFRCSYDNYRNNNIPSTLETAVIWSQNEYEKNSGNFSGNMEYGVDAPLTSDEVNKQITIYDNEQHMLTKGSEFEGYTIYVPKSGWYKIGCSGSMRYPNTGDERYTQENREAVGGIKSKRDCTDLSELPFEFQVKKGYPLESPKLYSFNSFIPCMPTHFADGNNSVVYKDDETWIKCLENEKNRMYGKNGKTTYIKDYSNFPIADFVCGARLGGAWFSETWGAASSHSQFQRPSRYASMGAGLALPNVSSPLIVETLNEDGEDRQYFKISDEDTNAVREYAERTAQVLIRKDSYSNFDGYNVADWNTKTWDVTSNVGKITYQGGTNSEASTIGKTSGNWNINTVVWLEQGDTLYFELLMPQHITGKREKGGFLGTGRHRWNKTKFHINRTIVDFYFEMGIVSTDKKWVPTSTSPIPPFTDIKKPKETNVNSLLPSMKCNDYLTSFLKTFNLQLTMPSKNTFSIDYSTMNNVMGNVISIESLANIYDAQFKALDNPSQRQLSWKIDQTETGYYHGNQSPYKTENLPWYNSGYTGSIIITNETNTSGSIDKKESAWSYAWYKDIKFVNGLGMSVTEAPVIVMADKEVYNGEYTYASAQDDGLNTNRTMRFFFLSKDLDTTLYKYIYFKYDEVNGREMFCKLLLPTNFIITKQSQGDRYYMLDYDNSPSNTDGGKKKTITDIFFNLNVQGGYEVEIPIKLPNSLYNKINSSTLVKFNDGLYKVKSIEGHDISQTEDATMTLVTLK